MIGRAVQLAGAALREIAWLEGSFPLDEVVAGAGAADVTFLVTPNNPTGASIDPASLLAVADRAPLLAADLAFAIDEAAHYSFFLEVARLYHYYYPAQALEALFDVINNFAMPGFDIIPNRIHLGETLYRAGVYGPRQYTNDVLKIALKNLSVADRRAFSRGIKKSRLVPDPDGNLRDTASFDFFDYNSVELAVQKLYGRINDYEAEIGLDEVAPTQFRPSGMSAPADQ
jgi:hypothetical protein